MGKNNNLLGESFSDWVGKQIEVRQKVLGKFNNRSLSDIRYYTSKTSWLQLTSGVNITKEKATQLNLPENFTGNKLAKDFILRGGTDRGTVTSSQNNKLVKNPIEYSKRGGILGNYNNFLPNTAYGFASTPDYGLSPMPGLIDAEVKSLNRGSLKEASVKIKCFNKYQFDIVDTLFLKLKYPVLLEWGHSIYLDDNEESQTDINTVAQMFLGEDTYKGVNPTQSDIYDAIEENKKTFHGNYDGILAYVKNFNWSLNTDGSYDITLSLISIGEIIESMKLSLRNDTQPASKTSDKKNSSNSLADFFKVLETKFAEDDTWYSGEKNLRTINTLDTTNFKNIGFKLPKNNIFYFDTSERKNANLREALRIDYNDLHKFNSNGTITYVKLGFILRFIKSYMLLYDQVDSPVVDIFTDYANNYCFTFDEHISLDPNVCLIPLPLKSKKGRFRLYKEKQDGTRTYVTIKKTSQASKGNTGSNYSRASTQPTLSFTTDSSQARTYNEDQIKQGGNLYYGYKKEFASTEEFPLPYNKTINIALGAGETSTNKESFKGLILEKKTKNVGKLMHIHVATGYILEVFKSLVNDKGEIILYDFLDSLMKGIQRALGNVNDFEVVYDNESNIFKIIDNTYIPGSKNISEKIKEKPYIINVNVLKENFGSFVKSVSISSEIDKDLAAELSIAATANSETSNQIGVNGSRFAHLNRGCENRIIVLADNASLNPRDNSTTEDASLETESPDLVYTNNMQRYNEFLKNMFIKNTGGFGKISDDEISEFTNTIPDYWNYKLGQEESIAGKSSGRGFIPINLSLTTDGLSGMKIYEKFTINNEYLPSNYVGVIDFIIKGISHKITDKGWETSLETFCIPSIEADVDDKVTTTSEQNTTSTQNTTSSETTGNHDQDVTRTVENSNRKAIINKYGWPIKVEQRGSRYYGIKKGTNSGRVVYELDPAYKNQWVTKFTYTYKGGTTFTKKLHQGLHDPLRNVLKQIEDAGFKGGIKNIDASVYARDTTNAPGLLSGHSFGVAMDFNSKVYGYGNSAFTQYQKDLKNPSSSNYQAAKAIEIVANSGLFKWGGNYNNNKDTHHFTFEPFST